MNKIKFILDGCDISFVAIAPEDITLKQLLAQCDRIVPDWCACGICSAEADGSENLDPELEIGYDFVKKLDDRAPCTIKEDNNGRS